MMGISSTYFNPTYDLPANGAQDIAVSYEFLMLESISDASITSLEARDSEGNPFVLAVGMKIKFDKMMSGLYLVNPSASVIKVRLGLGTGDVEDYRIFGSINSVPGDWGAAFSDKVSRSNPLSSLTSAEVSHLTPSGSDVNSSIDVNIGDTSRLIFCEIVETSGTPGAYIKLGRSLSANWTTNAICSVESGQAKSFDNPIYLNYGAGVNDLAAAFKNGATGYVRVIYEEEGVASGAV